MLLSLSILADDICDKLDTRLGQRGFIVRNIIRQDYKTDVVTVCLMYTKLDVHTCMMVHVSVLLVNQ